MNTETLPSDLLEMSEYKAPKRGTSLKAGGGQSSALSDHQQVESLSPTIEKHLERIYETIVKSGVQEIRDGPLLSSFNDFKSWFLSPASAALAPPPNHDLSLPLSNYYISSSHNTYLSGNQLYGSATTASYTDVLLRGCRCLEIDVWNGEDESSSVSSSDVEDAQHEKDTAHRRSKLARLKSLRGKAKDKLRRSSKDPPPEHGHIFDEDVDDVTQHLSATEIVERRARLKSEPRVYHGYTLTKDIPFREVCEAIGRAAFKASTLPVIVSLEVHCNLDQQQVMVQIMREVWAGHLVDMTGKSYQDIQELPSPDTLRNKILIKVKWSTLANATSNNPHELANAVSNTSTQTDGSSSSKQQKKAAKVLDDLSKLGVYTRAYSFKSFTQPEAKIPTHVFSLDENKLGHLHAHEEHGPSMFQHNRDYLVRIYPSGLRVNSSNIDPAFSWRQGAHMVALNWQSLDKGMMLNEGMFAGEEGYVLKPHGFRSSSISDNSPPIRKKLNLTIEVIAAQNLPKLPEKEAYHVHDYKPFVKFQLHVDTHGPPGQGKTDRDASTADLTSKYEQAKGHAPASAGEEKDEDERKLKRKSKVVRTVSYKTVNTNDFSGTEMVWTDVPDVVEELSFLRIKVMDDKMLAKDELVAWACIRLDRLKTGYRFLHLLDVEGSPCEGVLFVRINKTVH